MHGTQLTHFSLHNLYFVTITHSYFQKSWASNTNTTLTTSPQSDPPPTRRSYAPGHRGVSTTSPWDVGGHWDVGPLGRLRGSRGSINLEQTIGVIQARAPVGPEDWKGLEGWRTGGLTWQILMRGRVWWGQAGPLAV